MWNVQNELNVIQELCKAPSITISICYCVYRGIINSWRCNVLNINNYISFVVVAVTGWLGEWVFILLLFLLAVGLFTFAIGQKRKSGQNEY